MCSASRPSRCPPSPSARSSAACRPWCVPSLPFFPVRRLVPRHRPAHCRVTIRRAATSVCVLRVQAGYVSAGQAGAEIAVNGADSNPVVLGLGVAATIGAITVAGNIATSALKDLDLDLEE